METTFKGYRINATYLGNKASPWDEHNYNNHRVTVSKGGKRTSFEFWASIANPELRSPSDLREAFGCFLSDACAGLQSFDDFCSDFGYDTDSRKAEKTYRACERAWEKAKRILGDDDVYDMSNALNDQ